MTFFLNNPTPKRLAIWRAKAQQAAAERAGYAFSAYAQTKFTGIVERLALLIRDASSDLSVADSTMIAEALRQQLTRSGLDTLTDEGGGASERAIAFFRTHDVGFRIRRLQLLARRLARDWELDPEIPDEALDIARAKIYEILALYVRVDEELLQNPDFKAIARRVFDDPGGALDFLGSARLLPETDLRAEQMLSEALDAMPKNLKRRMLLTYLGFPFYDVATLPLVQSDQLAEYNPVKIDRISPDDARSIREGGTQATLRGTEFFNFGAFFSRAYRENDYLWGRLHGAERMVDFIASTVDGGLTENTVRRYKREAFLAIMSEEDAAQRCDAALLAQVRGEIEERLGT